MAVKPGWEGRYFEDFEIGDIYRCRLGRTVTEADNIWFTLLTNNTNQIHFNNEYGKRTEFGKCLINSALTLAIVAGMGVADVSENGFALGWDGITLPNPLFAGDTLYSESEVLGDARVQVEAAMGNPQSAHPRCSARGQGCHRLRAQRYGVEKSLRAEERFVSADQRSKEIIAFKTIKPFKTRSSPFKIKGKR